MSVAEKIRSLTQWATVPERSARVMYPMLRDLGVVVVVVVSVLLECSACGSKGYEKTTWEQGLSTFTLAVWG